MIQQAAARLAVPPTTFLRTAAVAKARELLAEWGEPAEIKVSLIGGIKPQTQYKP